MTTDELRAKFEAWALSAGLTPDAWVECNVAWCAWQAAHASRDAEVEALRKDAERWRHARKILLIADIEEAQRDFMAYGRRVSEEGCVYADEAIDAAMREESK